MLRILSAVEQTANHLRDRLLRGHWREQLPGLDKLVAELGVSRKTLVAALRQLEAEGFLAGQGARRKRQVLLQAERTPAQHVTILVHDQTDRRVSYILELQQELTEAGHTFAFASFTLTEMRMNAVRIAKRAAKEKAAAWVVESASREVLELFLSKPEPVFSLFGRRRGLPIAGAGPDKPKAYAEVVRVLAGLGHRRIVLLTRPARRLPQPGASESAFLTELAACGITPGNYHMPDWEESVDGFHARLDSHFKMTPPTALVVDEIPFFIAAQQFLARKGLRVPEDVSLVCTDADTAFSWCKPSISHIHWDSRPVVRRIVSWAGNVARGREDLRQMEVKTQFVHGGTIGPVKAGMEKR
ncbi:MAG: substrate-binding domain-containing protein [Verrucomicrobiota bacterium]